MLVAGANNIHKQATPKSQTLISIAQIICVQLNQIVDSVWVQKNFFFHDKKKREEKNMNKRTSSNRDFFFSSIDKNGLFLYVTAFFSHSFDFTLVTVCLCLCLWVCVCVWQTKHVVEILFKINAFFPYLFLFHSFGSFVLSLYRSSLDSLFLTSAYSPSWSFQSTFNFITHTHTTTLCTSKYTYSSPFLPP